MELNLSLQKIIKELSLGSYGMGFDIAEFINKKEDVILFASFIQEAIFRYEKEIIDPNNEIKDALWDFHKAILEYADTLK